MSVISDQHRDSVAASARRWADTVSAVTARTEQTPDTPTAIRSTPDKPAPDEEVGPQSYLVPANLDHRRNPLRPTYDTEDEPPGRWLV